MSLAPFVLDEPSLSAELIPKLASFLAEKKIVFELKKNRFKITVEDQKQYEEIHVLIEKIKKETSYLAALTHFPEVEVADLFVEKNILSFNDVLPYLEIFDAKGLCFNFIYPMPEKAYLIDALDHVKVIDDKEKELLLRLEALWGNAWDRSKDSLSAREWLEFTGLTTIETALREGRELGNSQVIEVLDYLIDLDLRAEALFRELEQGEYDSVKTRLDQHQKQLRAAKKSSFAELLNKARAHNESLAKKSQKHEDWAGIDLIFSFEGYGVFHLKSEFSKDRESALLRHCVGGGSYDDHPGIYSFRNKANQPLCTMEYSKIKQIIQIQGANNGDIPVELFPVMRAFIRDYLKLHPSQINDIRNTGWRRLELAFANPNSINGFKKYFFINAEDAAINLTLRYENLNTNPNINDALLKKINNLLSINKPLLTVHTFWGHRFLPHLKIPHLDSHQSVEALFKLSELNLPCFNDRTAKFIRRVNQKLPKITGATGLEELIEEILEFFNQGSSNGANKLVNLEFMCQNPKKHFKFYQQLLQILQKLNPILPLVMDESYVEALVKESRGMGLEAYLSHYSPELAVVLKFLKVESSGEGFGYGHRQKKHKVTLPELTTKDSKLKLAQAQQLNQVVELATKLERLTSLLDNSGFKRDSLEHSTVDSLIKIHKYFTESGIDPANSFALNLTNEDVAHLDPVLKQDLDFITYQAQHKFKPLDVEVVKNICTDIEWEISLVEEVFNKFQEIDSTEGFDDFEFQTELREAIEDLTTVFRYLLQRYENLFKASLVFLLESKKNNSSSKFDLNLIKKQ